MLWDRLCGGYKFLFYGQSGITLVYFVERRESEVVNPADAIRINPGHSHIFSVSSLQVINPLIPIDLVYNCNDCFSMNSRSSVLVNMCVGRVFPTEIWFEPMVDKDAVFMVQTHVGTTIYFHDPVILSYNYGCVLV